MLLFVSLLFAKFGYRDSEITNCNEKMGTSVLKIHVHVDELAQIQLIAETTPKMSRKNSPLTAISIWFGEIFDEINQDLQPYGVQIRGIFKKPTTLDVAYDRSKCPEDDPTRVRSQIASNVFLQNSIKERDYVGNRLMLFFCPNNPNSLMSAHVRVDNCSNVFGFLFGETRILRKTIKDKLVKYIFRTNITSGDGFNREVCRISDDCVGKSESTLGQYVTDLKSVRHISSEKYILNDNDTLNEHDLYDDIYVSKYLSKQEMKMSVKNQKKK